MKQINFFLAVAILSIVFSSCTKGDVNNEQVLFNETFDNNDLNWPVGDRGDGAFATIANGIYNYVNNGDRRRLVNGGDIPKSTKQRNAVETLVRYASTKGTENSGYAGLAVAIHEDADRNTLSSVNFCIDEDAYLIWLFKSGSSYEIFKDWVKDPSLVKKNAFNKLRIEQLGSTWNFYLNGRQVHTMTAQDENLHRVGYYFNDRSELEIDYLKVVEFD